MTFKYSADLDEFIRNNPSYEKIINFLLEYLNEYAPQEEKTYRKDTDTPIGNLNLYEKAEAYLLKFLSFMRGIDEGIPYDFSEYEINSNVKLLYSVFKGSAWREYIGYLETHLNEYLEKSKNMRFSNIQNLKDLIRLAKDGSNVSKIFLDLDGVLVDFDGGFKKISGMLPNEYRKEHTDEELWALIRKNKNFFLELDWTADGELPNPKRSGFLRH